MRNVGARDSGPGYKARAQWDLSAPGPCLAAFGCCAALRWDRLPGAARARPDRLPARPAHHLLALWLEAPRTQRERPSREAAPRAEVQNGFLEGVKCSLPRHWDPVMHLSAEVKLRCTIMTHIQNLKREIPFVILI